MRSAFRVLERACRPLVESLETRRLLSVVFQPEQTQDWGDLPNLYQTVLVSNGPRHLVSPVLRLGSVIDAEGNGQPSVNADADDLNPLGMPDDEDGVTLLTPLVPGQMATVQVINGGVMPGNLNAWVDFANNGTFADPIDAVIVNFPAVPGLNVIQFMVPNLVTSPQLYARFRLSQQPGLSWFGDGGDGEVEDYRFRAEEPSIYDFGDVPDSYGTTLAMNGAHHTANAAFVLGGAIDTEPDGQPSLNADLDDLTGMIDDEDGIVFLNPFVSGSVVNVSVTSNAPGLLDGWVDWNVNGAFDPIDRVFNAVPLPGGNVILPIPVPAGIPAGMASYARFRFSQQGGLAPVGFGGTGEVEDDTVLFEEATPLDFGDAPDSYGTTLAMNGAQHLPAPQLTLGQLIDIEPNGQPSANADGDDLNPPLADDEDGVLFLSPLKPGSGTNVSVTTTGPGALDAWVDFNFNGVFDPADQIFNALIIPGGNVMLNFAVPPGTAAGPTYARFRFSQPGGLAPTGFGGPGEVEDHAVDIEEPDPDLDFGDAPNTFGTVLAANGARHNVTPNFFLGAAIDAERDGQPSPTALLDDNTGVIDDEDGVVFIDPIAPGTNVRVNVTNGGAAGVLDAWMDFNLSGAFDPGEQIFSIVPLPPNTTVQLVFPVPVGVQPNVMSYARFRLSNGMVPLGPTGPGGPGEVEDYQVRFEEPERLDFGDAPDLPQGFAFPTIYGGVGNPARHSVVPNGPILGKIVDVENNGQPTIAADGDDVNPPIAIDDEDGVLMVSGPPLDQSWVWAGTVGNLLVSNGGAPVGMPAFLSVWADVNQSGNWAHPGERVITNMPLPPGAVMPIPIPAPIAAPPGRSFMYARFRLSTQGNLADYGPAQDGEVEDYRVLIVNLLRGDMNADGVVNNQDIAGFVLALTNPAQYPIQYPNGDIIAADVNMDGVINNQDIAPFVALLTGPKSAPTPTPSPFSRKPVLVKTNGDGSAMRLIEQLDVTASAAVFAT